jgi:hypothetical protein
MFLNHATSFLSSFRGELEDDETLPVNPVAVAFIGFVVFLSPRYGVTVLKRRLSDDVCRLQTLCGSAVQAGGDVLCACREQLVLVEFPSFRHDS